MHWQLLNWRGLSEPVIKFSFCQFPLSRILITPIGVHRTASHVATQSSQHG
jgi:hypothetical protein